MPDSAFTIPVDLKVGIDGVIQGLKNLQSITSSNPLKIDIAPVGGGELHMGDAKKFFDDIKVGADQIDKLEIKYRTFVNTLSGEKISVATQAFVKLAGAQGQVISSTENLNQATIQVLQSQAQYVETAQQTASLNIGKTVKETDAAYRKLSESVDTATSSAKNFLAKSENMTGKQVEHAKTIALEVLKQGDAFKEAYGQRNIEGMRTAGEAVQKLIPTFREAEAATKRGAGAIRSWADNLTNAIKQTLAYSFSLGALRTAQNFLNDGIRFAIELNKEMVNIQLLQAEGAQTSEEIKALAVSFNELAKELGATTVEVAKGSVEWLRQGKTIEETTELLRTSTMLSKLGNVSAGEATEYLTSTINSYGLAAEEAVGIVDKLIAVDNTSATSTKELATALRYAAAGAREAGVSIEQLISYIGVISQVTRLNAEQIGQAMKTIFARMQDIKAGAIDSDGLGINNVESALARVDVRLRDSETSFRDLGDVLEDVAKKWESLDEIEQANISKAIAGVRQRNMFVILMQNMNEALRLQKEQANSAGLTMQRYELYLKGVEAAQNKLKASTEALWQDAISSGIITWLLNATTNVLDFTRAVGGLRTIVLLAVAALIAFNSTLITTKAIAIADYILRVASAFTALRTAAAGASLATLLGTIATPVGWIAVAIAALTALAGAVYYLSTTEERLAASLRKSEDALRNNIREIKNFKETQVQGKELVKEYEQLLAIQSRSATEAKRFLEVQNELKELYPTLAGYYNDSLDFQIESKNIAQDILDIENAKLLVLQKQNAEANKKYLTDMALSLTNNLKEVDKLTREIKEGVPGISGEYEPLTEDQVRENQKRLDELKRQNEIYVKGIVGLYKGLPDEFQAMVMDELPSFMGGFFGGATDEVVKIISDAIHLGIVEGTESGLSEAEIAASKMGLSIKVPYEFDVANSEEELERLDKIREGYQKVDQAITQHGALSAEARKALIDVIGEEANLLDYLAEDGSVSLEKLRNSQRDTFEELREWLLDSSNNIAPQFRAALLSAINDVDNAMRQFSVNGIAMSREQFIGFANDASAAIWAVAQNSGIALQDSSGNLILTQEQLVQALIQGLVTYDSIAAQLVAKNAVDINALLQHAQSLASFWGGLTTIKPPSFVPSSVGGGGGKSAEEERLDREIKKLEDKKKALEDNLDEFRRYIDAQKESLRLAKEEKEFADEMIKKQKSLAKLKADIAILALDDSEEAKAARIALEEDAAALEEEIAEDSEDRKYELQIEALEKAQKAYEEKIQKQMDLLDEKIEKLQEESQALSGGGGGSVVGGVNAVGAAYNVTTQQVMAGLTGIDLLLKGEKQLLNETIQDMIDQKKPLEEIVAVAQELLQSLLNARAETEAIGGAWGVGLCFVGGTLISVPSGNRKAIEDIEIGDIVLSYDFENGGILVPARVEKTFVHTAFSYYNINNMLNVTGEHPLYVNNNWLHVKNIKIGDMLYLENGSPLEVNSIEIINNTQQVYNLHIGNTNHNYFANGILAHNKVMKHEGGLIEEHHDGDFAGGLRTNEVFAKLLEGEYVATEGQMRDFMNDTLPRLASYPTSGEPTNSSESIVVDMPITVQGNLDKTVIPNLEEMTDKVIDKINDAMKKRGRMRPTSSVSI